MATSMTRIITSDVKMHASNQTSAAIALLRYTEKRRFDALELEHLAQLESERTGRNESRLRFLGRMLVEQGLTSLADQLLTLRGDCAARGTDVGGDPRIRRLINIIKNKITDRAIRSNIFKLYSNLEDLINCQNWNRHRLCWHSWEDIVSVLDHRLVAINITGRQDRTIVDSKIELDDMRDRIVNAMRPFANWYSWHLDVSLLGDNRHPHYHCMFVVPASLDRALFDAVDELKKDAFWNDEGLDVNYRDWLGYDRRRRMLDVAERQQSWIAALAYVTRVTSSRPLPTAEVKAVPTLSSFLDVDDHISQIKMGWNTALGEVLKRNDFDKALGARRMALFLRKETGRRVVSFRQSRRWKSFGVRSQSGVAPLTSGPGIAPVSGDEGNSNPLLDALEAAAVTFKTSAFAITANLVERCSKIAPGKLEQKDSEPAGERAADYDSKPSMVIDKGFKENSRGRPRREISHQQLMLAIIKGGTCKAAAGLLRTSTRRVRAEMVGAGIEPFRRGRPMKKATFTA